MPPRTLYLRFKWQVDAPVADVHNRMPVILPPDRHDLWLDPFSNSSELSSLSLPYDAKFMRWYAVSTRGELAQAR